MRGQSQSAWRSEPQGRDQVHLALTAKGLWTARWGPPLRFPSPVAKPCQGRVSPDSAFLPQSKATVVPVLAGVGPLDPQNLKPNPEEVSGGWGWG